MGEYRGLYSDDPKRDKAIGQAVVVACGAVGGPVGLAACEMFETWRQFVNVVYSALPDSWKAHPERDPYHAVDPWETACMSILQGAVDAIGGGKATEDRIIQLAKADPWWHAEFGWDSGEGDIIVIDEYSGYFPPFGARTRMHEGCDKKCFDAYADATANLYEAHRIGPLTRAVKKVDSESASIDLTRKAAEIIGARDKPSSGGGGGDGGGGTVLVVGGLAAAAGAAYYFRAPLLAFFRGLAK